MLKEFLKIKYDENKICIIITTDIISFDNSNYLKKIVLALLEENKELIIDLEYVRDISSSGLGVLVDINNFIRAQEKKLIWKIENINQRILNNLKIVNFDNILPIQK